MKYLLNNETAAKLYESVKDLPIIDYHNHLSLSEISENKRFTDIYDLWIKPDPYKHRVMRMCGVDEEYITGNATSFEKFKAWCTVFPKLLGNQIYVWSKTELEAVFGISETVSAQNAESLYKKANKFLAENDVTPEYLMKLFKVELACPCTSFTDGISFFCGNSLFSPSLRGDGAVNVTADFVKELETKTDMKITCLKEYENALKQRLDALEDAGLKFADHALDNGFIYYEDDAKNGERFEKVLSGKSCEEEQSRLSSYILTFLGHEYAKRKIVLQLHIGAQRKTSTRLRAATGPAGGYAGIGNSADVVSLVRFLDTLDSFESKIPKTVLFTLNPADNALFSVLSGSFSKSGVSGVITQGPAWWWCDHKSGIRDVLESTSAFGLLSNFIGMTTDSRSYLSFLRHDYFRRVLCDFLAEKFNNNELLCEYGELETVAKSICYYNASEVFL